jgi:hypothetical protein
MNLLIALIFGCFGILALSGGLLASCTADSLMAAVAYLVAGCAVSTASFTLSYLLSREA